MILCAAAVLFLVAASIASASTAEYELSWTEETFPTASVEAELEIGEGRVATSSFWATFFENERGWSQFVEGLRAFDAQTGAELSVLEDDGVGWLVGPEYSGAVRLTYRVAFEFARERYDVGNEQLALLDEGALYSVGLPLFVYSPSTTDARIIVRTPDRWKVATSWTPDERGAYSAPGIDRLTRNAFVVGDFSEQRVSIDDFDLTIALVGVIGEGEVLVRETFEKILKSYTALFDYRDPSHFLLVVLPGPNDGEAYFDSFASSTPEPPRPETAVLWASSLAHEFFHYWNGKKINTAFEERASRQWFSEGFTEYFALQALCENQIIDWRTYDELLSQYLSFHLFFATNPAFRDVSIKDAGARKWPNRPGVYDSGVAVAFCMDGMIREQSEGTRSLSNYLKLLYDRFGTTGKEYVYEDLIVAATETAGQDMRAFFADHIEAKTPLPVEKCAAQMGYKAEIDFYHVILRRQTGP